MDLETAPESKPRSRPPGAILLIVPMFLLAGFSSLFGGEIARSLGVQGVPDLPVLVTYLLWGIWLAFLVRRAGLSLPALIGRPPENREDWKLALLAGPVLLSGVILLLLLTITLFSLNPELIEEIMSGGSDGLPIPEFGTGIIAFLAVVILAPITEELAFRGLLLPAWSDRWGTRRAIIGTSTLFAILHPLNFPTMWIFAAVLAAIYLRTSSLPICIGAHMLNNVAVFFVVAASSGVESGSEELPEATSGNWVMVAFLAAVYLMIAYRLLSFVIRTARKHEITNRSDDPITGPDDSTPTSDPMPLTDA